MDRLPRELIDAILHQCIAAGKATVLTLRLVCRLFDHVLKPFGCRTLQLEYSRLSKASPRRLPLRDALQTIGYHCKAVYIDLMVLRDDLEVDFLDTVFAGLPSMEAFCRRLRRTHCMNDSSFTELEYRSAVEDILFNCRDVDSLRLNLPFQLVGRSCSVGTMVLAITMDAFAKRPEEDSARLKVLVMENLTDIAVCNLWTNPSDIQNIMTTMNAVEHLVISVRRHQLERPRVELFSACFWDMVRSAKSMRSLSILGLNQDERTPRHIKMRRVLSNISYEEHRNRALPAPQFPLSHLTSLELKRVDVSSDMFESAILCFGETLEELFLNEVYLQTEYTFEDNCVALWVGLPNRRPPENYKWIAMRLRESMPRLRLCRASFLGYDDSVPEHWIGQLTDVDPNTGFDLVDPSGRGRSLAQRFVEVAEGIRQPRALRGGGDDAVEGDGGEELVYFPRDEANDYLMSELRDPPPRPSSSPGPGGMAVQDYDANAYQLAVANTTSRWHKAIDTVFPNCNKDTLDELHGIAETACRGMDELRSREVVQRRTGDNVSVWQEVVGGQL